MAMALEQTVLPDGRVELAPEVDAGLGTSGLHNEDLAPVPIAKRTWTTYNYLALWVGMAINVPTLGAGLGPDRPSAWPGTRRSSRSSWAT